jgi:hypothetical protein
MHDSTRERIRLPAAATRVVAVPAGDAEFVRRVHDAAATRRDTASLEAQIRSWYPRARIRANELSGLDAVLYAYRDGHWEPSGSS